MRALGLLLALGAAPPAPAGAQAEPAAAAEPTVRPPRLDGGYIGIVGYGSLAWGRVNGLSTSGPPFVGYGGGLRVGEVVLPWLSLGLQLNGGLGYRAPSAGRQRIGQGALLVDGGFMPVPRLPLSLHVGFGVGGGAVRQEGVSGRSGFGGAVFTGAVRYEWFPGVARYRPRRGGGFGLGPELGWIGMTPAATGRPMSNTVYLGLAMGFYLGS